jgi:HK97 family phage major capsid protein
MEDNLIYYGDAVKVLGEGRVGGYLVRYSNDNEPDLEGDYFDAKSDLGIETGSRLPVYYQHGFDPVFQTKRIGRATAEFQEVGVWLEAQLEMRDEYERGLMELAEAGKLGWSSGAAGHLVEREQTGKSWHIKSWPIAEASLTPTPAEPRNAVISVKSLLPQTPEQADPEPDIEEGNIMAEEVKAPEVKEVDIQALIEQAAKAAVLEYQKNEPQVKAGIDVTVVEDEADKASRLNPFDGPDFFKAVYRAEGGSVDKRLLPLKASGLNEAIPSEGGYLVPPEIANGIQQNMWNTGQVLSQFTPRPVMGNSMTINAIDETSRAAGSRMGGVRGYWLAEAGEKTSSYPTFRQIELKLKKVAALVYASDEMLDDVGFMSSWISTNVPNELRFLVEDAIMDGDGIGKPRGIIQSGALISATRTDANQVDADDIGRMWSHRYPGLRDYVWFVNAAVLPQLYRMTIADGGYAPVYTPPGGLSQAPYGQLLGRPVIETEYNPYLGTVGDILLASPSQYAFIHKQGGIQAATSIHVRFVYDESAFRFVYRCDGESLWNADVDAFDGTHTVSPFVALCATT